MPSNRCRLCLNLRSLVDSHIVPAFVFRWLRETSATGYLRSGATPNKREQDGWKRKLLCTGCEQVFARYERGFAMTLFHQIVRGEPAPYAYGAGLAKFLASVAWRALVEWCDTDPLDMLTPRQRQKMSLALDRWGDFVLGRAEDVGPYELHFLPGGIIAETTEQNLPP